VPDLCLVVSGGEHVGKQKAIALPQSLDETLWQILRVFNLDEHGPAIEAVFFQVLVKPGITEGNDVASEIFWICKFDRVHSVVV
jgi:hypothetical protein